MKRNAPDFTSGQFFALQRGADLASATAASAFKPRTCGKPSCPATAAIALGRKAFLTTTGRSLNH
jgi:hypothetical protein